MRRAVDLNAAFEALLSQMDGSPRAVVEVQEEPAGPQGYSGSQVRYFRVTSVDSSGGARDDRLIVKRASLLERRIVSHLCSQGCAVPPASIHNLESPERLPIVMPYLEARPQNEGGYFSPLTHSMATGLAGIHAANMGQPPAWLPRAADDFAGRLWLREWREQWAANLAQPDFAAEFAHLTNPLEAADERLLRDLTALAQEGTALTLLNVDLIPDHIRLWRGQACFIDWEQAAYGPLYLDLPNAFSVETVLAYRDALERQGYTIPVLEFMECFHAVSPYMGLRYLGYSLWQWAQGGVERERGRWFLHYTLHLALHGR